MCRDICYPQIPDFSAVYRGFWMVFSAMADITLISAGLTVVSQILQAKFAHRDEMKGHQEKIKAHQKKMNELMKKDDQHSKNQLESVQGEMMEEMNKMMSKSTKVMMFSLVVFLPAFFILGHFYGAETINLPIPLPWLSNGFDLFSLGTWGIHLYSQTNWYGWYFISYIIFTILIGQAMNITKIGAKKGAAVNG